MIEYVIPHTPDLRVLRKGVTFLREGELIIFPTDTNWIVACDPHNKKGIERLYKIKDEQKKKHYSLICHDISIASDYAIIDNPSFKLLKKAVPGHYTFIFEATKLTTKILQASKTDKEVGLRFIPSVLVSKICEELDGPILGTQITPELLDLPMDQELYSYQLEEKLKGKVSLIIDPGEVEFVGPSTIVDLSQGTGAMLVRVGAGDTSLFD